MPLTVVTLDVKAPLASSTSSVARPALYIMDLFDRTCVRGPMGRCSGLTAHRICRRGGSRGTPGQHTSQQNRLRPSRTLLMKRSPSCSQMFRNRQILGCSRLPRSTLPLILQLLAQRQKRRCQLCRARQPLPRRRPLLPRQLLPCRRPLVPRQLLPCRRPLPPRQCLPSRLPHSLHHASHVSRWMTASLKSIQLRRVSVARVSSGRSAAASRVISDSSPSDGV